MTDPKYMLPGNMHWNAEDPEQPLECWSDPINENWDGPEAVHQLLAAVSLPNIFVATRVLTVDEDGDVDETEAAWFHTEDEALRCFPESLAAARDKAGIKDE